MDGTQIDVPDSVSNGKTFDGPATMQHTPLGFPQVRAVVLGEVAVVEIVQSSVTSTRPIFLQVSTALLTSMLKSHRCWLSGRIEPTVSH
ncbi:hypothetical protein [Actinomadura sp. 9N215]|uniref:hypothetical protein n=1 Tax=Actinomadura sp. 9N215 TaxID=3375150 RepID=UPI0037B03EF8